MNADRMLKMRQAQRAQYLSSTQHQEALLQRHAAGKEAQHRQLRAKNEDFLFAFFFC